MKSRTIPLLAALLAGGCGTVQHAVMKSAADLLAAGGSGGVYAADDDPELVRDALPFALKTHEMVLANNPHHRELLQATAAGFIRYANAFVQEEAERMEEVDLRRARQLRQRAVKLYVRGRDYALRGLELSCPGFLTRLEDDPGRLLKELQQPDVPLLYWAAAGWGGALSADTSNMNMMGDLPLVERLMRRALELDETYDHGAIHEFFIVFEGGRNEAMGGSADRALEHFNRSVSLSGGDKASPYVAYAASVAVQKQDAALFKELLNKALKVDVNKVPDWRLANILSQQKAQWLLDHGPDLFLEFAE